MKSNTIFILLLFVLFFGFTKANAQITEQVQVHGFGAWGGGISDGNKYLGGSESGDFDILRYALNLYSSPYEKLTLNGQFEMHQEESQIEMEIDYSFAEWTFSDALKFRIGRVKHPFGIFSEIYDVGTVRPFFELPQGVYGPVEIVAEGFQGIGFSGSDYTASGWGISYDIYAGEINLPSEEPWEDADTSAIAEEGEETENAFVFGGRIIIEPNIEGLSMGLSGYYGNSEKAKEGEGKKKRYAFGVHCEYLLDHFSVRGEYVFKEDVDEDENVTGAYLEAAYKFNEQWQAVALYDYSKTDIPDFDGETSLLDHTDIAFGVNYWFNPNFVLKLSYHMVDGNRFTQPEDEDGEIEEKTGMFMFGSQFSF